MPKPIVIVCGTGRSGSSLMMRMLHHGGMPVMVDSDQVLYETSHSTKLPKESDWLQDCEGAAVKILDIHKNYPPKGLDYRFILMVRNYTEQAKSHLKLQKKIGFPIANRKEGQLRIKAYADQNRLDTQRSIAKISEYGMPLLIISFESIIVHPLGDEYDRICDFLKEFDLDADEMAKEVIKRSPKNYNGFLEDRYAAS